MDIEVLKTENETRKHILDVQKLLGMFAEALITRGCQHDKSKLEAPELEGFAKSHSQLKSLTYGSEAYQKALDDLGPILDHHYGSNSHHPEAYPAGINDMNLIDIIEMLCDWIAATKKHRDGSVLQSLEVNTVRFNISPQLLKILNNTVDEIDLDELDISR